MSTLYIDDKLIEEFNKQQNTDNAITKVKFEKEVQDFIDNRYKSEDSERMYALFTPEQRQILRACFKEFSVGMYRELNETVDLQISKHKERIKDKIYNLMEGVGVAKWDLNDWVYDGMVDTGKNNGIKCDLCPRPVRYAHFAASKSTGIGLKFGCNCASEFFNMDKGSIASLKTIQAQTLRDIKIIACILETQKIIPYYKYMCGYMGRVYLESGKDGLLDLTTFTVKWDSTHKNLIGDVANDAYPVYFDKTRQTVKSLRWIKDNIVSCLNADLDDNLYERVDNRNVVYLDLKNVDKAQAITKTYVQSAITFIDNGLPVPLSIAKKINSIVSKVTRQHHPDYIKFSQELLISHNLAKSSLLKTAFTDFMVNYLASSVKACERDDELVMWNIRGQLTFYNVVLLWEQMMTKLIASKDLKTMINKGLISEEEFEMYLRKSAYNRVISYSVIKPYIEKCIKLFISNKEVVRTPSALNEGFSKYSLKGVDERISVDTNKLQGGKTVKGFSEKFTPDVIPYNVAMYFHMMEDAYKQIIRASISPVTTFLSKLELLDTDKAVVEYLCRISATDKGVEHDTMLLRYSYDRRTTTPDPVLCDEILKKYKKELKSFRKDALELYAELRNIVTNLRTPLTKITSTSINEDYDTLFIKKEKSNRDYFEDYCKLLIGKRGNKYIQSCIRLKNLKALTVFTALEPYTDMFTEIQRFYIDKIKNRENGLLFEEFKLDVLLRDAERLKKFDLDTFKLYIAFEIAKSRGYLKDGTSIYTALNTLQSEETEKLVEKIKNSTPEKFIEGVTITHSAAFEAFYNMLKLIPKHLVDGMTLYEFYSKIVNKDAVILNQLKENELTCKGFKTLMVSRHGRDIFYYPSDFVYTPYLLALDCYIPFKDVIDNVLSATDTLLNEYVEEKKLEAKKRAQEIEENKRLKETEDKENQIKKITAYLNEHIRFTEVTSAEIEDYYKQNPSSLGKKSESSIRRKLAFNTIHYESANEMIPRFLNLLTQEVTKKGKSISDSAKEVISKISQGSNIPFNTSKIYAAVLRTECYNHSLVFNHLKPCYNVLKLLQTLDLNTVYKNDLDSLESVLKNYFILLSDLRQLDIVLSNYNIKSNLETEIQSLAIPPQLDVKSVLDKNVIDDTGLSGVDKAKTLLNDAKFSELHISVQSIIKSVVARNSCTPNQNNSINKAYEKLGFVPKGTYTTENADIKEEGFKKIALLKAHPDYDSKIPDYLKSIIDTMETRDMCTTRQLYNVNKGLELLDIKV